MEDVLELKVEENEFEFDRSENCQKEENLHITQTSIILSDGGGDLTLSKAKEKLLESLKKLEEDAGSGFIPKSSVKRRLGVRESVEQVEFMDYSDSEQCDIDDLSSHTHSDIKQDREQAGGNEDLDDVNQSAGRGYEKRMLCKNNRQEDIPRRPSMDMLCKRLRVKWHHSPEKIGKEIAARLEEPKYNLIINVVKTIGGKKAIQLFHETKQMQLNGGMFTNNGSRRRTSGGVFLTLLKTKNYATEVQIKDIFREDAKIKTEAAKRKRALQRQRRREKQKMDTQSVEENSDKVVQRCNNNE